MTIPDRIRIGGVEYAVKMEERIIDDNGRALCGQIDYNTAIIRLEPNIQDEQGKKHTLIHEIMHGIAKHFGLSINEDEDVIDKLATGMYMVIADNPEMFQGG
jgi:predicted Zn-dependent protease with MMP-like domain